MNSTNRGVNIPVINFLSEGAFTIDSSSTYSALKLIINENHDHNNVHNFKKNFKK